MKQIYQVHNIGIYIDGNDPLWRKKILDNIKVQFDGFEVYNGICDIKYKFVVRPLSEIKNRKDYITVPDCSKFYVKDDIFYSEYLRIAFQIREYNASMWTDDITWYSPYILETLFEQQGITFVHGASVALNCNEGKLLLAFGGIGKTCFVANAVKRDGVSLLGDDLILLSKDGCMMSYPRPFCLYDYHVELFPQFFSGKKIRFKHLKRWMVVSRFCRKMKQWLHIKDNVQYSYLPVSPIHLFHRSKIQLDPVQVSDVYVLRRNADVNEVKEQKLLSEKYASNFAIDVILHEWDIGLKLLLNYYAQKGISFQSHIQKREEIIEACLKKSKNIKLIDIPEKMKAKEVSVELNKLIIGC